jgi:hypothetical protein
MTRTRLAALAVAPLLLLVVTGCRESARSPVNDNGPGASVQNQFNDVESTLDNIESELNDG